MRDQSLHDELADIAHALVANPPTPPPLPVVDNRVTAIDSAASSTGRNWRSTSMVSAAAAIVLLAGLLLTARFNSIDDASTTPVIAAEPTTQPVPEQAELRDDEPKEADEEAPQAPDPTAQAAPDASAIVAQQYEGLIEAAIDSDWEPPAWFGIHPGAMFGYFGATPRPDKARDVAACSADPIEQLIGFPVGPTNPEFFSSGLLATGNLELVEFFDDGSMAAHLVCAQGAEFVDDIVTGSIDPNGFFIPSQSSDGEVSQSGTSWETTTPDGRFVFGSVAHPDDRLHCYGAASLPVVSDSFGERLAINERRFTFGGNRDYRFGPNGLVAFSESCEIFRDVSLGRITDDGSLTDLHRAPPIDALGAIVDYAFTSDGESLFTVYWKRQENGESRIQFASHAITTDVGFVETATPAIDLGREWKPTADGDGSWYSGPTRSMQPACGSETLYRDTLDGLARVLPVDQELDRVVDIDWQTGLFTEFFYRTLNSQLDETQPRETIESHLVVISTECGEAYEGRTLWFGFDGQFHQRPGGFTKVDTPPVQEVLSVTGTREEGFVISIIDRDGSPDEVLLTVDG